LRELDERLGLSGLIEQHQQNMRYFGSVPVLSLGLTLSGYQKAHIGTAAAEGVEYFLWALASAWEIVLNKDDFASMLIENSFNFLPFDVVILKDMDISFLIDPAYQSQIGLVMKSNGR
jgi:hypothetical protein